MKLLSAVLLVTFSIAQAKNIEATTDAGAKTDADQIEIVQSKTTTVLKYAGQNSLINKFKQRIGMMAENVKNGAIANDEEVKRSKEVIGKYPIVNARVRVASQQWRGLPEKNLEKAVELLVKKMMIANRRAMNNRKKENEKFMSVVTNQTLDIVEQIEIGFESFFLGMDEMQEKQFEFTFTDSVLGLYHLQIMADRYRDETGTYKYNAVIVYFSKTFELGARRITTEVTRRSQSLISVLTGWKFFTHEVTQTEVKWEPFKIEPDDDEHTLLLKAIENLLRLEAAVEILKETKYLL